MNKKYNVVIAVFVFFVVLGGISTMFYINLKNNKTLEVEATVKMIGNDYIIVEDGNGEEYSLTTDEEYNVGDRVDFLIKDVKEGSGPIEGTVVKIDVISRNISFSIMDGNGKDDSKGDSSEVDTTTVATDGDIITYFTTLDNKLDTYNEDKSIGDSLKSGFVTVIDFLFYDGEIKGKTFEELSTTAKIKVLQIAFSIDEKIEKYFPGYKETISTTGKKVYTSVKAKATELYLDIVTEVCKDNSDTCEAAKQGLSDLKENFSLTWEFIKDAGSAGLTKLKEWYEVWKEI